MEPEVAQGVGVNWLLVLTLGGGGIVVGLLASFVGLKQRVEPVVWILLYGLWVVVVRALDAPAPFRTLLFAGPVAGILNAVTSLALLDNYRRKNPWYTEQLQKPRGQLAAGFFGMGIAMGLIFGAIFGGIATWLAR